MSYTVWLLGLDWYTWPAKPHLPPPPTKPFLMCKWYLKADGWADIILLCSSLSLWESGMYWRERSLREWSLAPAWLESWVEQLLFMGISTALKDVLNNCYPFCLSQYKYCSAILQHCSLCVSGCFMVSQSEWYYPLSRSRQNPWCVR